MRNHTTGRFPVFRGGAFSACIAYACMIWLLAFGRTGPAQADTVSLNPVKDNTMYFYPATSQTRSNGIGCHIFAGIAGNGGIQRGLLEFNVSTIPSNVFVSSARLVLNMSRTPAGLGNVTVNVHRVLTEWGEGNSNAGCVSIGPGSGGGDGVFPPFPNDATWFHAFNGAPGILWTTPGGDFASSPSAVLTVGPIGVYTFGSNPQSVADVQSWVSDANSNHGWILIGPEMGVTSSKRFDSREITTVSLRPILEVTYSQTPPCPIKGDVNNNGAFNSTDIQAFINCLTNHLSGGEACPCADVNCDNIVSFSDVSQFADCVLATSGACPCP